jgi:hypothetical protein
MEDEEQEDGGIAEGANKLTLKCRQPEVFFKTCRLLGRQWK